MKFTHVKRRIDRVPREPVSLKQIREIFLREIVALVCEVLDVWKPLVANPDGETPADVDTLSEQISDSCKITVRDSRVGQEASTKHQIRLQFVNILQRYSQAFHGAGDLPV